MNRPSAPSGIIWRGPVFTRPSLMLTHGWSSDQAHLHLTDLWASELGDHSKCRNCMMSPINAAAGSVGVPVTGASNARNAGAHPDSVRTVRATVIAHCSAFSKGLHYHHRQSEPWLRRSRTRRTSPRGAASACATIQDMKRSIAPQESSAATVGGKETSISSGLIGAQRSTTSSCTERTVK